MFFLFCDSLRNVRAIIRRGAACRKKKGRLYKKKIEQPGCPLPPEATAGRYLMPFTFVLLGRFLNKLNRKDHEDRKAKYILCGLRDLRGSAFQLLSSKFIEEARNQRSVVLFNFRTGSLVFKVIRKLDFDFYFFYD